MVNKTLENIFRIDSIRIMKILEMCQFSIIGFGLGYLNGKFINEHILIDFKEENYINKEYPKEIGNHNPKLWLHLFFDIIVIVVTTYYLKKITRLIPFIFSSFEPKYKPGLKSEGLVGFTIGLGFIYLRVLDNFINRMNILMGK
tara:strand:+ start:295 stop:726 length:432 start_codon:yes stop_codon:yes gene_type:complete